MAALDADRSWLHASSPIAVFTFPGLAACLEDALRSNPRAHWQMRLKWVPAMFHRHPEGEVPPGAAAATCGRSLMPVRPAWPEWLATPSVQPPQQNSPFERSRRHRPSVEPHRGWGTLSASHSQVHGPPARATIQATAGPVHRPLHRRVSPGCRHAANFSQRSILRRIAPGRVRKRVNMQ